MVKHWNNLPVEIREARNVKKFTELLDGHLALQQHPLLMIKRLRRGKYKAESGAVETISLRTAIDIPIMLLPGVLGINTKVIQVTQVS